MNDGVLGRSVAKGGLRKGGAVNCLDIAGLKMDRSGTAGKDCCLRGLPCLVNFAKELEPEPNMGGAGCEAVSDTAVLTSWPDDGAVLMLELELEPDPEPEHGLELELASEQ